MKIKSIKTDIISPHQITLEEFVNKYIKASENSVVAVTSKVISTIEGRFVPDMEDLDELISKEADRKARNKNKYNQYLTIKYNNFIGKAGIDRSNSNGKALLLPEKPQETAKKIYDLISKKEGIRNFGVIITDSRSLPLRAGAMGTAIGFWGFSPLKNYVGQEDLFGRKLLFERANILDALAAAAVMAMGEGNEQTPIAIIEDIGFVDFNREKPTPEDLCELYPTLENDYFHQFYENIFD